MFDIYLKMIEFICGCGDVTAAHLYDSGYASFDLRTKNGEKFQISIGKKEDGEHA